MSRLRSFYPTFDAANVDSIIKSAINYSWATEKAKVSRKFPSNTAGDAQRVHFHILRVVTLHCLWKLPWEGRKNSFPPPSTHTRVSLSHKFMAQTMVSTYKTFSFSFSPLSLAFLLFVSIYLIIIISTHPHLLALDFLLFSLKHLLLFSGLWMYVPLIFILVRLFTIFLCKLTSCVYLFVVVVVVIWLVCGIVTEGNISLIDIIMGIWILHACVDDGNLLKIDFSRGILKNFQLEYKLYWKGI